MTIQDCILKYSKKISESRYKEQTTLEILNEINILTYENNTLIRREDKLEIIEGILKLRFPYSSPYQIQNSNEEYIKILTEAIKRNK